MLPLGSYTVCVVPRPERWRQTTPARIRSHAPAVRAATRRTVTLTGAGQSDADLGNIQIADISGSVFTDANFTDGGRQRRRPPGENWSPRRRERSTSTRAMGRPNITVPVPRRQLQLRGRDSGILTRCASRPSLTTCETREADGGNPNANPVSFPPTTGSDVMRGAPPKLLPRAYAVSLGASNRPGAISESSRQRASVCSCRRPEGQYVDQARSGDCKRVRPTRRIRRHRVSKLAAITPAPRRPRASVPLIEKITLDNPPAGTGSSQHRLRRCTSGPTVTAREGNASSASRPARSASRPTT